jgi:hypothetical protein
VQGQKKKYDARRSKKRRSYVVEVFVREPVTFHFSYAIDEQGTRGTHETARGGRGERLFEHIEEGVGVEGRVLVSRRLWWRFVRGWIN